MRDIGPIVSCISTRGASLESIFIRATHGRVPGVIQMTQVTMWADTGTQMLWNAMLKPSQEGSSFI